MRKLTDNQLAKLINYLDGTCNSLSYATEVLFEMDEDDLSIEDCQEIDQAIFCCEQCGWWQEISCMAEGDDWVCEDCI